MIVAGFELIEDDLVALLAQRLARLRARVVELAGLTDDDRARADERIVFEVVARAGISASPLVRGGDLDEPHERVVRVVRAGRRLGVVLHRRRRRLVSWPEALAVPSFSLWWVTTTSATPPGWSTSTANPWFWEVTSTRPVASSTPGGAPLWA